MMEALIAAGVGVLGLVVGWLKFSFGKLQAENKYHLTRAEGYRDELKVIRRVVRKARDEEIDTIPVADVLDGLNSVLQKRSGNK
jgi:hypothetical protein